MVALSDEKTIFDMYIKHNGSDEIIKFLESKYNVKRKTILLHIRNYIKTSAKKEEINLYNKVVHQIDRYKDYRNCRANCNPKSHYFKYFNILLLLTKRLDEYMLSDDYIVIVNYIDSIKDKITLKKDVKNSFYNYIKLIYSLEEAEQIIKKIEKIIEIYKLYSSITKKQLKKDETQKNNIKKYRKIFSDYLLELSKMNLFEILNSDKLNSSRKYLIQHDYDNYKYLEEKEEELKKELEIKEKEKIREICNLLSTDNFDILDYYLNYGYNLWNVINKSRCYGMEEETTYLFKLYSKYISQNIFVENTFLKLDYKFYLDNNEYILTADEKILIINFIRINKLPKTYEIAKLVYFKYKTGLIDLSQEKILRKN